MNVCPTKRTHLSRAYVPLFYIRSHVSGKPGDGESCRAYINRVQPRAARHMKRRQTDKRTAGRALVKLRWDKTPKAARSKHAQVLADAYWKSPAGIAKRRAVLVRKITELQAKLVELDELAKRL